MKRVLAMTFHGAHNYGSVLQAYALQEAILEIGRKFSVETDFKIINYRTQNQKRIYDLDNRHKGIKGVIKNIIQLPYRSQLKEKYRKFEEFINGQLHVTEEISIIEDDCFNGDYYISGSDQVFNIRCEDFDWHYLLDFTRKPKISYAASCGPLKINWDMYDKGRYSRLIHKYEYLSAREEESKKTLCDLSGKECDIHIDPTLLIDSEIWQKLINRRKYNTDEYIFFYCLEPTRKQIKLVYEISKVLHLPVVIAGYYNKYDYLNRFEKNYDTGPLDFLFLINTAKLVLTSSFHGTAFSVNFKKPFFVFDGIKDNRIQTLLNKSKLESRSVDVNDPKIDYGKAFDVDFTSSCGMLRTERERSSEYLARSLGYINDKGGSEYGNK